MNRYDYYTRCASIDEQEWLTEELYYPENENTAFYKDAAEETYYAEGGNALPDDKQDEEACCTSSTVSAARPRGDPGDVKGIEA